jgi:hypothetical protein
LRYIVTLLILLSFTSGAQTIQGVVTDAVTAKPLTAVTVVNVASQMAVYSNDKGFYSIIANPGDFIVFTYVGYRTVEKPKPLSVLISTMNITMEHTAYELQAPPQPLLALYLPWPRSSLKRQNALTSSRKTLQRVKPRNSSTPATPPTSLWN